MKTFFLVLALLGANIGIASSDTLTVVNTNDDGPGSLRQAIADAAAGDTIDFDLPTPAVIGLTSDELFIDKSLTIAGPGRQA
jgi:hypothetical protein